MGIKLYQTDNLETDRAVVPTKAKPVKIAKNVKVVKTTVLESETTHTVTHPSHHKEHGEVC